jgi:hypothetical protein
VAQDEQNSNELRKRTETGSKSNGALECEFIQDQGKFFSAKLIDVTNIRMLSN